MARTLAPFATEPTPEAEVTSGTDAEVTSGTEGEVAPKQKRSPLKEVPLDLLAEVEEVPEEEWGSHSLLRASARSDMQKLVDAQVKSIHDKWIAAGRPNLHRAPRARRTVSPEFAPAVRKLIASAAQHHKISVRYFETGHTKEGKEVLVYAAIDRDPKLGRKKTVTSDENSAENSAENAGEKSE
jgi:hypothetical protein